MYFLEKIDDIYNTFRTENSIPIENKNFYIEIPILISQHGHSSCCRHSYIIRKSQKAKLLICQDGQRIYLSDYDIINTILSMDSATIDWFLTQFISLFSGCSYPVELSFDGITFVCHGIDIFPNGKNFTLFSDTTLAYSTFCLLLNYIFAKDYCWEAISGEVNSGKLTLCKYISIIDYYYKKSPYSRKFLLDIGYPIEQPFPSDSMRVNKLFKKIGHLEKFDISFYK